MRWVGEYSMPKVAAKPSSPAEKRQAEEGRPRNAGDAVRAAGQALPVEQDEADDLAEGERDDGEIVAAQPQHRKAEQDAPERGEDAGERQADPERQPEIASPAARRNRRRPRRTRRSRDRAGRRGRPRCSGPSRASRRSAPGCRDRECSGRCRRGPAPAKAKTSSTGATRRPASRIAPLCTDGGTTPTVPTGPHHCRSNSTTSAARTRPRRSPRVRRSASQ